MHNIRAQSSRRFLIAQDVRLFDMFDGVLPPEPPEPPAPAAHDFLVMCLRPDGPPQQPAPIRLRSAA